MKTSRGRNKVYVACTLAEVSVRCERGDHQSLRECLHVSMCSMMIVMFLVTVSCPQTWLRLKIHVDTRSLTSCI